MYPYTNECMDCIYGIGQPCLTFWANCMKVTYDNYSAIEIMKHSLTIFLQLFYKY